MFDINQAIRDWRASASLTEDVQFRQRDLDELEDHLLEEFKSLYSTGLSEEEAFLVATHRLGPMSDLAAERSKLDPLTPWKFRLTWILIGYLILGLFFGLMGTIGFLGQGFALSQGFSAHLAGAFGPLLQLIFTLILAGAVIFHFKKTRPIERVNRIVVSTPFLVFAVIFTQIFSFMGVFHGAFFSRIVEPETYAQSHLTNFFGNIIFYILISVSFAWIIARLGRTQRSKKSGSA